LKNRKPGSLFPDFYKEDGGNSYWQPQHNENLARLRFIINIQENYLLSFYEIVRKRLTRIGRGKVNKGEAIENLRLFLIG